MKKLFKGLKPYMPLGIAAWFFVAVQGVSELFLPEYMSRIVNEGLIAKGGHIPTILNYGGIMLALTVLTVFSALISSYFASKISSGLSRDIRSKLFAKVSSYSLEEFDKISTSSLITRSTNDVTQIQNVVYMMFRIMTLVPIFFVGSFIMTGIKQPQLLWVLAVSLPLITMVVLGVAKFIVPLFKKMQQKLDNLTLVAREGLTGVRVVRAFNRQELQSGRFNSANREVTDISIKANKIMAIMMPIVTFIMNVTMVAIMWFGFLRMKVNPSFQPGDLMAVIQYIMHIMFSIMMVTMIFVQIPRASASAKRINEVLDMPLSVTDLKGAVTDGDANAAAGIEFKNVSFRFGGAAQKALDGVSFTAAKGKVTAVVGSTGSGKSTVLNLISRFYDATEGEVLVLGENVKNYSLESLRQKMGIVPQKAFLFSGTIESNIKYAKKDATDEQVVSALKTAQAYKFVTEKEGGVQAVVEQGGANFSGGQKQRLAIARAIVREDADIFVFDDAFSALDFKTDAKLRSALTKKFKSKTLLIVAQRISTVMNADNIIVLNEGKLVGSGKHKDLLNSCTVYREIAESQLDEKELSL